MDKLIGDCIPMNIPIVSILMKKSIYPSEPVHYVQVEFENRRRRNPNYSARAFARDLGLSPSHLSEFFSGKSKLSPEKASELGRKLKLSGSHFDHWCDLLFICSRLKKDRDGARFRINQRLEHSKCAISQKVFEAISDWHHFAILTCFGANSEFSPQELKKLFTLPLSTINKSISTLVDLNLLKKNSKGYTPTEDYSLVGNNLPSEAIRESHRQILNKSIQALDQFGVNERESQSLFLSIPKNQLSAFRQDVKTKVLQIAAEYSETELPKDDLSIQAVTFQIFPIKESSHEE